MRSLPVKWSRSSASSGAGLVPCSRTHSFFILLVRAGRRPWRDDAPAPSPPWSSFFSTSCRSWSDEMKTSGSKRWWSLKNMEPRETWESLPLPGGQPWRQRPRPRPWTGSSAAFGSKLELLELLSGSTRAGRQGPDRASSNFFRNLKRVLNRGDRARPGSGSQPGSSVLADGLSPMGLLHRLLDGPETDVVPPGDLDEVLRTTGVVRQAVRRQESRPEDS